jgi:hypothetical protein
VRCRTDQPGSEADNGTNMGIAMLHAIAAMLMLMWLVGVVTSFTLGGLLHILPVIAIEFAVLQFIVGEDPV